jgi:hypothetical protein
MLGLTNRINFKSRGDHHMPMSIEEALGTLIRQANPYTNGQHGAMGFAPAIPHPPQIDPNQIQMEEDNYAAQWAFKGLTHNIKRSLKIKYTFDKKDAQGNLLGYKVTEYLLIGFAGSNG